MTDELDCSDGAKMLIERMQSNPEEFRGGSARWAVVMNQMLQVRRGGTENNIMMSKRDMNALFNAFEKYVMETALAEHVVKELMEPKPARKQVQVKPWTKAQLEQQMTELLEEEYKNAFLQERDRHYAEVRRQNAAFGLTSYFSPI